MGNKLPFVSVVMPVRNEARFISQSLLSVLMQDYPAERMEVIIADGYSTDATRKIIGDVISRYPHPPVRIVDNPGRVVPTGLNAAIKQARGDIIVRIDGHTSIAPDYVTEAVSILQRTKADNVGGLMTPIGQGWIAETIALAHSVRFGLGGGLFHRATHETEADTVYMGTFRRDVFERVGFFDETLVRNQDIELNGRIRQAGGRIILSPRIRSRYFCRNSLRSLWKQNYGNGLWLTPTIMRMPQALSLRHFVPMIFVTALLSGVLSACLIPSGWRLLVLVAGAYLLACLTASILAASRHGWRYAPSFCLVFPVLHLSYGLGSLVGVLDSGIQYLHKRLFAMHSRTERSA